MAEDAAERNILIFVYNVLHDDIRNSRSVEV